MMMKWCTLELMLAGTTDYDSSLFTIAGFSVTLFVVLSFTSLIYTILCHYFLNDPVPLKTFGYSILTSWKDNT